MQHQTILTQENRSVTLGQTLIPLLYAYTPECYPTHVRNLDAGVPYGVGRAANVVGPIMSLRCGCWQFRWGFRTVDAGTSTDVTDSRKKGR